MHSVISQGRVEEIVLSAPRDRRLLVEEAAGLGKHRKRRRRAQLKLERTQDNLDRALDVEREARTRLRPLKRQAQAADIHARLEREAAELRARLLAAELLGQETDLAEAERRSAAAREQRAGVDAELAEVMRATRRDRGAARRARSRAHRGLGTADGRPGRARAPQRAGRGAGEPPRRARAGGRTPARGARVAGRRARRCGRWPIGRRPGRAPGSSGSTRHWPRRANALDSARSAGEHERAAELAKVRDAADRAAQVARRLEDLLGSRRQGSLAGRLERESTLLAALEALCEAAADARDAAGERAAALERRTLGEAGADDVTDRLRACSREEAELQTRLREIGERSPRRRCGSRTCATAVARPPRSWSGSRAWSGASSGPPRSLSISSERAEIELKLERLGRRREQLGPVNPLAEREYEEALAHVEEPRDPAQRPRDRAQRAAGADPRDRPQDQRRVRADLRGDAAQLRGAGRAPVPGRPRPPAARRRQPRPGAGPRRRRVRVR